jgi:hypothetical protein
MKPLILMIIFSLLSGFAYGSFQVACKRVNTGISQDKLLIIIYLTGMLFVGGTALWRSMKAEAPTAVEASSPPETSPTVPMMIMAVVFLCVAAYSGDKFAVMANFVPGSDPVAITGIIALSATLAMSMECLLERSLPNRWHVLGCFLVVLTALALAKGSQVYEAEKATLHRVSDQ